MYMKKLLKQLREDIDECKFHGTNWRTLSNNYECVSKAIATLDKLEGHLSYYKL